MRSLHTWPSRHSTRHPPQLAWSLEVSTHFPKQNIWPAGHCRACAFTEDWVRHRSRPIVSAPTEVRRRTCSAARPRAWPAGRVPAMFPPILFRSRLTAGAAGVLHVEPIGRTAGSVASRAASARCHPDDLADVVLTTSCSACSSRRAYWCCWADGAGWNARAGKYRAWMKPETETRDTISE